jgi:hypothetical protein
MSNRGQSQYLRIFDESSTYYRWQNYYVGQTVTWDTASWVYQSFVANGFIGGSAGTDVGVTVDVPATGTAVSAFESALNQNRLCELRLYEFDSSLGQAGPQSGQLLIGVYVGEIIGINGSFSQLTVSLGSSLAPVGAQVPPRKFTNAMIGAPLRL